MCNEHHKHSFQLDRRHSPLLTYGIYQIREKQITEKYYWIVHNSQHYNERIKRNLFTTKSKLKIKPWWYLKLNEYDVLFRHAVTIFPYTFTNENVIIFFCEYRKFINALYELQKKPILFPFFISVDKERQLKML